MRNAGFRARKKVDFLTVQLYAMRVPHIVAGPTQILCILAGTTAEFL